MKHIKIFSSVSEYETAKSGGTLITPNVSLINETNSVRYLPELDDPYNGHEYVDLGLPSGIKWATYNLGAKRPEDCGLLFAWGETTGYNIGDNHDFINKDNYNGPSDELILQNINNDYIIPAGCDAATVNMGGKWRIPTKADFEELIANCVYTYRTTYDEIGEFDGYCGVIFKSRINGNSIFIPNNGDDDCEYWTSSGFYDENESNIQIYQYNNIFKAHINPPKYEGYHSPKYEGYLIRPVCE